MLAQAPRCIEKAVEMSQFWAITCRATAQAAETAEAATAVDAADVRPNPMRKAADAAEAAKAAKAAQAAQAARVKKKLNELCAVLMSNKRPASRGIHEGVILTSENPIIEEVCACVRVLCLCVGLNVMCACVCV